MLDMIKKKKYSKPSNASKFLLFILLLVLNVVIRIPSIPHEKGYDSFFIHSLANSISYYGIANWWIKWLSVFGLYPYSYASAVPFTLSGISQLTELNMETTILFFCIALGIFSIFSSYILASILFDDFTQRYLLAYIFSVSAATVNLTTWEITTRAQILVFFPLMMYITVKIAESKRKYIFLFITTAIFLFATHHFVYLILFFMGLILMIAKIDKVNKKYIFANKVKQKNINLNHVYVFIIIGVFVLSFLFSSKLGLVKTGSRYQWLTDVLLISIRSTGFIFPISVTSFIYLSLKNKKTYKEWALLICLIPTLLFSYNQIYGYLIVYIFLILLATFGLYNITQICNKKNRCMLCAITIIMILVFNTSFSAFFSHYRLGMVDKYSNVWYMQEETYITGKWVKEYIDQNKIAITNGYETGRMRSSYGGIPRIYSDTFTNYIYGLMPAFNESDVYKNSIFSTSFYFDSPYVLKNPTDVTGVISWISDFPVTDGRVKEFINKQNISYFFDDRFASNTLSISLGKTENKVYDSGRMIIWDIKLK